MDSLFTTGRGREKWMMGRKTISFIQALLPPILFRRLDGGEYQILYRSSFEKEISMWYDRL
jgi:hypothetical protein